MKISKTRRALATVAVAASAAVAVVVPAVPAEAATCHWTVIWQTAGVYSAARSNSTVLKTKYLGDVVGPYCDVVADAYRPGEYMVVVHCDCAALNHGYAYMRKDALRKN